MDLAGVRQAMADAVNTVEGLTAYPINPGQLHPPCALVDVEEIDYRTAMQRGHDKAELLVRVLLGTASNEAAQQARDAFFNAGQPKDIKDAIEGHAPLRDGTRAFDAFVATARRFDGWEYNGAAYLGVELLVEVYA